MLCLVAVRCLEGVSLANPPVTPWEVLEVRAAQEGVAAVRADYYQRADAFIEDIERSSGDATPQELNRYALAVSGANEFLGSLAKLEAQAVRHGTRVDGQWEVDVWQPLVVSARSHVSYRREIVVAGKATRRWHIRGYVEERQRSQRRRGPAVRYVTSGGHH